MGTSFWNPLSWLSRSASPNLEPTPHGRLALPATEFATTVFTGTADEWNSYLLRPRQERYDPAWTLEVIWKGDSRSIEFQGASTESQRLAAALNEGFDLLRDLWRSKPQARAVLEALVFENPSNGSTPLFLQVSPHLPSKASREILLDDDLNATEVCIVLDLPSVEKVLQLLSQHDGKDDAEVRLGLIWPLLRRVISQLAYPGYPRDQYLERIDLTTKIVFLNIQLLFRDKKKGWLRPTRVGEVYERYVSERDDVPVDLLQDLHPYFRMLRNLGFMLQDDWERSYLEIARVVVRDYLDTRYVRLGIASVMPDISDSMLPLDLRWKENGKPQTDRPTLGKNGVLDQSDLEAWHEVVKPFRDLGFVLVRQLGIGQYGRVYEAVNFKNGAIPRRVAIKVDRIRKRKTEEAILAAETILKTGHDLAYCPHVIRIFDAGKIRKKNHTYHVLQLVDGDTLDNLVGITGNEHASIPRPERNRTTVEELQALAHKSLLTSGGEAWRRARISHPFVQPLSIFHVLELMTSILLWVEEIHRLRYAVNDLKNGNLMVSRRGQLKGIDLDSYSPAFSPMERQMDFHFLSVSLLLFLFHFEHRSEQDLSLAGVLTDKSHLRKRLDSLWPPQMFAENPRMDSDMLNSYLCQLLLRCRKGDYAEAPDLLAEDIDQLIRLKRRIRSREIILD